MATKVIGLSEQQHKMLKKAFGYESYPNGESGHNRKAVEWLKENMGDKNSMKAYAWLLKMKPFLKWKRTFLKASSF